MKTCLIVDDVTVSRYTSKLHLEELGLSICEAEDEDAALDVLDRQNVDVVLLDWHLRQKSGIDLLRTIRQSDKYSSLPVIMFSGVEGEDNAQEAINAGANAFITKPATKESIELELKAVGAL